MQELVVIGGGFAGLWAAAAAARRLDELRVRPDAIRVTLINRDAWHVIRVRTYEQDLSDVRVPLDDLLQPIGVRLVLGEVHAIDAPRREVHLDAGTVIRFDRLVLASGSALHLPDLPGLAAHAFHVDTFEAASRLNSHIKSLGSRSSSDARDSVVVAGAGLTGIEVACEMPDKLAAAGIRAGRVTLVDALPHVGSDMGDEARPVIERALHELGIEIRTGVRIVAIDAEGVTLADGERIPTQTFIWSAGMRASPLARMVPGHRDPLGRLRVDPFMRVESVPHVFAAGDVAAANLDGVHTSVMSCQHGRPMGRFAGHNAVGDLLGLDLLPLRIEKYVTCLDLGKWGALYTEGWDRRVIAAGAAAKDTKQTINRVRIYPPRSRERQAILEAAAPVVQAPPLRSERE